MFTTTSKASLGVKISNMSHIKREQRGKAFVEKPAFLIDFNWIRTALGFDRLLNRFHLAFKSVCVLKYELLFKLLK